MKKVFLLVAVVFGVCSCLDDAENHHSYVLDMDLEDPVGYVFKFDADSLLTISETGTIMWLDPSLALMYSQKDKQFQGGFRVSKLKGEADDKLEKAPTDLDIWRVHDKGGAPQRYTLTLSDTYAVFYDNASSDQMPKHDLEFGYKEIGACSMYGCYVNNTTSVARKVREVFQDGDKMVLKATGYKKDGAMTSSAEIVLAEYSALKDSVIYNWTPFDLSALGTVDFVDFEIISTKPEVPEYVCIDGIMAGISISY